MKSCTKRRLSWILTVCLLLGGLLAGCADRNPPEPPSDTLPDTSAKDSTAADSTEIPLPSEDLIFPVERLREMKVVYHEGAGERLIESARSLAGAIGAAYQIEIPVTSDYLRANSDFYCEKEYEILVGLTDRKECDAYRKIRSGDSVYTAVGTKILVLGGNEDSTVSAVSNFTYDIAVMKKGGEEIFFNSLWTKRFPAQYRLNGSTVNGIRLEDFRIVYSRRGNQFEKGIANHLASAIESLSGYRLDVVLDSSKETNGCEILVGKTSRSEADSVIPEKLGEHSGMIGTVGKKIVLCGADSYGIGISANRLLELLLEARTPDGKTAELTLKDPLAVSASGQISFMTFNLKTFDMSSERNARAMKMISTYLPDVVGLQEVNSSWISLLEETFGPYYQIIGLAREPNNKGERTSIMVAKHRFDLLEEGTRWLTSTPDKPSKYPGAEYYRIFTYAKIKDRATGQLFFDINTHLDTASDLIRTQEVAMIIDFLKDYQDLPVILMGDLNSKRGSSPIKAIQRSQLTSVSEMVESKNDAPTVDWIFVTADCAGANLFRICNERIDGDYPSDHYPAYAQVSFFVPDGGIHHRFGDLLPESPPGMLEIRKDGEGENLGPIHRIP